MAELKVNGLVLGDVEVRGHGANHLLGCECEIATYGGAEVRGVEGSECTEDVGSVGGPVVTCAYGEARCDLEGSVKVLPSRVVGNTSNVRQVVCVAGRS